MGATVDTAMPPNGFQPCLIRAATFLISSSRLCSSTTVYSISPPRTLPLLRERTEIEENFCLFIIRYSSFRWYHPRIPFKQAARRSARSWQTKRVWVLGMRLLYLGEGRGRCQKDTEVIYVVRWLRVTNSSE